METDVPAMANHPITPRREFHGRVRDQYQASIASSLLLRGRLPGLCSGDGAAEAVSLRVER